jgi:hypothetical protein
MEDLMSRQSIPYPTDFEVNYHADRQAQRVARARQQLDPTDVLAVVEDMLASQPDPAKHPLLPLAEFYLDRRHAVCGATLYDQLAALVKDAIDVCVTAALARGED